MEATEIQTPPENCAACMLRAHALYADVADGKIPLLERLRIERSELGPKRILIREGERPAILYTLFDGWAVRFKILPDGQRQILSFLLPGDLIAFQGLRLEPMHFSVQTLTRVQLCAFSAKDLADFFRTDPRLAQNLRNRCFRETIMLDSRVTDLGRRSATERLARLILELDAIQTARGMSDSDTIQFPLRQRDIADALGLTPVHVSRVMMALRSRGLIGLGKDTITIYNRRGLNEAAGAASDAGRLRN